jgi:hypothetical protein
MATFGRTYQSPEPSEMGIAFPVDTRVTFTIYGKPESGVVTKQLRNSAVVEVDADQSNAEFVQGKNGVVVINYKSLKKI